jgi:hypothetical protein
MRRHGNNDGDAWEFLIFLLAAGICLIDAIQGHAAAMTYIMAASCAAVFILTLCALITYFVPTRERTRSLHVILATLVVMALVLMTYRWVNVISQRMTPYPTLNAPPAPPKP